MELAPLVAAGAWDWGRFGLVIAGGLALGLAVDRAVAAYAARGDSDRRGAVVLGRLVRVAILLVALIYALPRVGVRIAPLLTAAGLGGVAVAFAVQNILQNFLAGILLLVRRPFRPGDQVATGENEGVVEDVNLRTVVLRTYDGQRVYVPNGDVVRNPIVNRTAFAQRRTELVVGVGYDSDLEHARRVIERAVAGAEGVLSDPAPEALVFRIGESSIDLCVRFWHASAMADMWRVRHAAAVALKRALDEAGIEMPFPQLALRTGAPQAGAAPG